MDERGGAVPAGAYIYGDYCTGEILTLQGVVQTVQLDTSLNLPSFGEDEAREVLVVGQSGSVSRIASASPPPPCSYSLSSTDQLFLRGGGDGSFGVICSNGCNWIVASNASWITITSNSFGSGTETVTFLVRENFGASARTGLIHAGGQTLTVTQAGFSCTYALDTSVRSFGSNGGVGAIPVTAPPGCPWTAVSDSNWIVITSGSSYSGNATVMFTVSKNTGAVRIGSLKIAGRTVIVKQKPQGVSFG